MHHGRQGVDLCSARLRGQRQRIGQARVDIGAADGNDFADGVAVQGEIAIRVADSVGLTRVEFAVSIRIDENQGAGKIPIRHCAGIGLNQICAVPDVIAVGKVEGLHIGDCVVAG